MVSDASIDTKDLRVSVQANGLIRRADTGYLIAKLCDGVAYDSLPDEASTLEEIARLKGELAEWRLCLSVLTDGTPETAVECRQFVNDLVGSLQNTAIKARAELEKAVNELAEAREQYSDLQEEHAEEVGDVCQAERARCVASIQAMIDAGDPASYCVAVCKATIAAIEETTP